MRKLQTIRAVLVQKLPLDPNLQSQLGARDLHVHAASGAMAVARLSTDDFASGPTRLVELTARACQRMTLKLQPAQLALGLTRQGQISAETGDQRRFSKDPGQFLYLIPPNQDVALHFHSPNVQWQHLCICTQALSSSCQSLGIQATNWLNLKSSLEQSCQLLNTLLLQLKADTQPEASAQMILLHLASRLGQGIGQKAPDASRSEQLVQQALGFFQDQIHRPINLADVCAFCGISPRRLQTAFQSCLECTPMEALLQERLKALRQQLLAGRSVSDACERVGLRCTGRTARLYLDQYGELPRETRSGGLTGPSSQTASSESTP
jgi:AraC-like DNA-binding protein